VGRRIMPEKGWECNRSSQYRLGACAGAAFQRPGSTQEAAIPLFRH